MLVLGIDPGTRRLGWGLVRKDGTRLTHVAHGVITPGDARPLAERLVEIERGLGEVLAEYSPERASIESIFFAKDAQAASKLGHARGVALLVCARAGLGISEFPPARVKRTVAGGGRADKAQIALMVRALLRLAALPPSDAADALALAITCLQQTFLPDAGGVKNERLLAAIRAAEHGGSRAGHRRRGSAV
jgi:crossover junction endodeoxyribonuclease RuvC